MRPRTIGFCLAGYLLHGVAGWVVDPPSTADPNTAADCTLWHVAAGGDTCPNIANQNLITTADFLSWNPSVGASCTLITGNSYCVERNWGIPPETSSTSAPSTTSSGNGVSTPTPTQSGMTSNCNKFDFVDPGTSCSDVLARNSITLADLYAWNTGVGPQCTGLFAQVYICVGVIGSSTSIPISSTTTAGNGIATPTPTQSGMVSNCDDFYFVKTDDSCAAIASSYHISVADFYTWNPDVKTDCSGLWANVYVCVSIVGQSPSSTTTAKTSTTSAGNGITTPTPTQPGMVPDCNKFYFVKPDESCSDVASKNSISLDNFKAWNKEVGSTCSGLWANVYACVGVISSTTTSKPTTTTAGNGVATPTPTQPGMVANCDQFHKVTADDTCDSIVKNAGISLSKFYEWNTRVGSTCSTLWVGYYVCTSII